MLLSPPLPLLAVLLWVASHSHCSQVWCCFHLLCGVAFSSLLLVVPSALGLISPPSSFWCCLVSPSSLWVVLLSPLPCGGVVAFPCAVWWCCLLFLPAFLGLLGWVLLKSGFEIELHNATTCHKVELLHN